MYKDHLEQQKAMYKAHIKEQMKDMSDAQKIEYLLALCLEKQRHNGSPSKPCTEFARPFFVSEEGVGYYDYPSIRFSDR